MTDGFTVALDRARAAYARGLAGCPADRDVASETLGLWHRMLARPPHDAGRPGRKAEAVKVWPVRHTVVVGRKPRPEPVQCQRMYEAGRQCPRPAKVDGRWCGFHRPGYRTDGTTITPGYRPQGLRRRNPPLDTLPSPI